MWLIGLTNQAITNFNLHTEVNMVHGSPYKIHLLNDQLAHEKQWL